MSAVFQPGLVEVEVGQDERHQCNTPGNQTASTGHRQHQADDDADENQDDVGDEKEQSTEFRRHVVSPKEVDQWIE